MGDYLVIVYSCVIDGWLLGYSLFMCNWWVINSIHELMGDYLVIVYSCVIDGWLLGYSLFMCNWWVITWL